MRRVVVAVALAVAVASCVRAVVLEPGPDAGVPDGGVPADGSFVDDGSSIGDAPGDASSPDIPSD